MQTRCVHRTPHLHAAATTSAACSLACSMVRSMLMRRLRSRARRRSLICMSPEVRLLGWPVDCIQSKHGISQQHTFLGYLWTSPPGCTWFAVQRHKSTRRSEAQTSMPTFTQLCLQSCGCFAGPRSAYRSKAAETFVLRC